MLLLLRLQKEGEVVVIPVDSELKEYGEAVLHPKS